ncbi:MAG: rRNA pseudouridine synthase [Ruminococcaceae bacterium]|nr:rRNA pseudouridine synthase [Oscillospiraceae bacterium]
MEKIRLQKYFTDCGVLSRRAAEKEIEEGRVKVNGHPAPLGTKIDPSSDIVVWKGKPVLPTAKEHHYIALNKPRGYITSTSDPQNRKCVTELLEGHEGRVYPIGRLDYISEGLLLLTDDGTLANRLTHPKHHLPKVYRVKVAGHVSDEQYEALTGEMEIDGYKLLPVFVDVVGEDETGTLLKMTLNEGRNRQIRKMCEKVGLTVKRLCRVSIGNIKLDGLPVGKWRYLSEKEVAELYRATGNP